jgi:hypothetical protein
MSNFESSARSFEKLADRIEKTWIQSVPLESTFLIAAGWNSVALTPADASDMSREIAQRIRGLPDSVQSSYWNAWGEQADQIQFSNYTSDPNQVARATFEFLMWVNLCLPAKPADVDWDKVQSEGYIPRKLTSRIRGIEARLDEIDPRISGIGQKIELIESAHDAAERLPTEMAELEAANDRLRDLVGEAAELDHDIREHAKSVKLLKAEAENNALAAAKHVAACEEAVRFTTSVGLAGAFETRSRALSKAGWFWVLILVCSLGAAVYLGTNRLDMFRELTVDTSSTPLIVLNLLLALLGVGGPVWLAWLATRNIGQLFRLSEDYAFKASVSKAYEGYRKEAINLDIDFAKRLFGSALDRLDESPSRFISEIDRNSPLDEVMNTPAFKSIAASIPDIKDRIIKFILEQKGLTTGVATGLLVAPSGKTQDDGKTEP